MANEAQTYLDNNSLYLSPLTVMADIARIFKSKPLEKGSIIEWCAQVEIEYIKDISTMIKILEYPLTVVGNAAKLPCNVFRILDVYEDINSQRRVIYNNNGSYLYNITDINKAEYDDGTVIYMNYVGLYIDDNGYPLIYTTHRPACETYCKIKLFEEDTAYGKFDRNMWGMWNNQFSGQIHAAKSTFQNMDQKKMNDMIVISANMIPRVYEIPLTQNMIE